MAYDYSQEDWYDYDGWGDDWKDEWGEAKADKVWRGKKGTGRLRYRAAMKDAFQRWQAEQSQSGHSYADSGVDETDDAQQDMLDGFMEAIDGLNEAAGQGYGIDWSNGYPVVVDHEGNVIQDFSQYGDQIEELQNMDIPSMQEFAQNNGFDLSGANQNMEDLIAMLTDPGQQAADEMGAQDYFHRLAGITDPDYMQNLLSELDAGMGAQEGMGQEERDAYQRAIDRQVQQLERTGDRQLDAVMGSYGSQMRGLSAAEGIRQQIGDARVQGELAIVQEDQARRQYNFEQKRDRYSQLLQTGQVTQQQYMEGLRADRMSALQGYASQIDAMTRSYGAEIEGIRAHADIMYNTLMADLGISQAAVDFGNNWFDSQIQPYLAQIQAYTSGMTALSNQDIQEALDELLNS